MDLFEYQGKQLFARWEIPISEGRVATSADEAKQIASELGGQVVVKAQVQIGGRGKAGGIKLADSAGGAFEAAKQIIGMDIRGHTVERVLVERASDIKAEYYAAVTLDRAARKHLFLVSSKGGVDIEEVAETEPQAIAKVHIDPLLGLQSFQVTQLVLGSGIDSEAREGVTSLLPKLYKLYIEADASLVEVNPMILTAQGEVIALDSKVSLDDSALYRHREFEEFRKVVSTDPYEIRAKALGLNFIKLDGNVGIIGNGAGLVMSTLDLVEQAGGKAANFLDVGGGANAEMISGALEVILSDPKVRSVLVNIFGGITRCDLIAKGVVDAVARIEVKVPIVVRLDGTNAEEGRALLAEANHPMIIAASTMLEAAGKTVEVAR